MTGKVQGFRFGAISAGIRKDGRIDLALAVCDRPAVTAALFTRNLVKAAVSIDRGGAGKLGGFTCCARQRRLWRNAATGEQGLAAVQDDHDRYRQGARHFTRRGFAGFDGRHRRAYLPVDKQDHGASRRGSRPSLTAEGHEDFAQAICTTDRWTKISEADADGAHVLAMGKGARGMTCHPDVGGLPHATMLVFILHRRGRRATRVGARPDRSVRRYLQRVQRRRRHQHQRYRGRHGVGRLR